MFSVCSLFSKRGIEVLITKQWTSVRKFPLSKGIYFCHSYFYVNGLIKVCGQVDCGIERLNRSSGVNGLSGTVAHDAMHKWVSLCRWQPSRETNVGFNSEEEYFTGPSWSLQVSCRQEHILNFSDLITFSTWTPIHDWTFSFNSEFTKRNNHLLDRLIVLCIDNPSLWFKWSSQNLND